MKNCEEITSGLLTRRDQYVRAKQKRNRITMYVMASFGCLLLMTLLGMRFWQGSGAVPGNTEQPGNQHLQVNTPTVNTESNIHLEETQSQTVSDHIIHIHRIETGSIQSGQMGIALMWHHFIPMSEEELNTYYGLDVFPDVPDDLQLKNSQSLGIFSRDGEIYWDQNRPEYKIYWDQNRLEYKGADDRRWLCVDVNKGGLPFYDFQVFPPAAEKSLINHQEVMIGQTPEGVLYAEFLYQNNGFSLGAEGLSQEEFIAVIESIIE